MMEDGHVFSSISFLFLLVSIMPRLCNTSRMELSALMYLQMMLGAARPRCLFFLDNKERACEKQRACRSGCGYGGTGGKRA